ncbi:MAG: hypothetical protein E7361_01160 [Clostridiales bacterium]|nr:hypothetical protein [Clostridiales bacterium]
MSTKQKTTTYSWGRIFRLLSFIAVVCVGISLLLSAVLGLNSAIGSALKMVGDILSYIVVLFASFSYVAYKRNVWFYLGWVGSLVLIVLFFII